MPAILTKPVPNKEAAKFIADKPVVSREVFDQLLPDIQARAFTIKGIEDANVVQAVRDRIAEIPLGADWAEAKKDIAAKMSPWLDEERAEKRAELLLRTHGYQAYSAAQHEVMARQTAAFPYWQYQTADDDRVRDTHAALDGIVLPADSPFWATHFPPWDFGCRCQVIPLTADDVADMQAADAKKPIEERRVLDDVLRRELENNGVLNRALPGDNGVPRRFNVNRVEREGAYKFDPSTLKLDAQALSERYDPEVWKGFESFARQAKLEDGRTVLEWLNQGKPATRRPSGPTPAGASVEPPPAPVTTPAAVAPAARKAPVSAALEIKTRLPVAKHIRRTIALIDQVHDDGALPKVPITGKVNRPGVLGFFSPSHNAIGIANKNPLPHISAAHEIGHLLDWQVLGLRNVYASGSAPELAAWRTAVQNSRAIQLIKASLSTSRPIYNADYLLRDREIWARAYSQYIAVRSRDPEMLRQLDALRQHPIVGQVFQWSDEDFAPIASAIDDIFRAKGWIR